MMTIQHDWTFWQNAIAGATPETTPGTPHQGYFRNRYYEPAGDGKKRVVRYEAVAIWFDPTEGWQCARSKFGSGAGMTVDQIDELFASCCRSPVSYEVYQAFSKTGKWPDDVEAQEPAPQDDDKPADVRAGADLASIQTECKGWLMDLGHKPQTQEEADKAANYADAFAKIEKQADKDREAEKKPHLDASRAVDAKWKPTIEAAAAAKKWAKGLAEDFAKAEAARRAEAARIENERRQREYDEQRRKAQEEAKALAAVGVQDAPVVVPEKPKEVEAEAVKIGTGARRQSIVKREVWEVVDVRKVLIWLSERNTHTQALLDAALAEARDHAKLGTEVPGLDKKTVEGIR